ncbi:DUF2993 domain-containing protein [Microbacterium chocolatum]|uniref:LmeA family phospholipid-binding protein n=1 Tax=Microbacterium aurantiacum TaxID=162393 RepID=UPI0033907281
MADQGQTRPTEPLPDWAVPTAAPARRRRRVWPWIAAVVVIGALAIGAWFAGEAIARSIVTATVREQVITALDLPADQPLEVEVAGTVLPQLIAGRLDELTLSSDDVALGDAFTGDILVVARGVPIRGGAMDAGSATVTMDADQLRALLATIDSFPVDTVDLAAPDVTVSIDVPVFAAEIPVGVALTPVADGGDIVLTPSEIDVAGTALSADRIREQFGLVADVILRDWTVCVADQIPAGVTLREISVQERGVVAELDIDGAILSDSALQAEGACA